MRIERIEREFFTDESKVKSLLVCYEIFINGRESENMHLRNVHKRIESKKIIHR